MNELNQVEKLKGSGLFTNYIYKAIPLAFDESMSYYETLCGLLSYLKNQVIPTVNNNADAMIELQNLYTELKNYVDNYFTNLDVQTEINNKLDAMVTDGTLDKIINEDIFNQLNEDISEVNMNIDNQLKFENNRLNYMLINNQTPTVVFAGDSITYGQGADKSFVTLMKEWIDIRYNMSVNFINKGIPGALSSASITNFPSYKNENPNIIFWEYGINDSNQNITPNETCKNLVSFYNLCLENNIEMIVILPTQTYKIDQLYPTNYKMRQLYLLMKATCEKLGILYIDMYKTIETYLNSNSSYTYRLLTDGTHFSSYKLFSDTILSTLLSSIKRLSSILTNILHIDENGAFIKTNGNLAQLSGYSENYALGNMMYFSYDNYEFEYTFYNEYPINFYIVGYENANASKLTFDIDGTSFTINENNPSNNTSTNRLFNSYYRYPYILYPGIHTIKLTNIQMVGSGNSSYIGGFICSQMNNINMPFYQNNQLFHGSIQNGTINFNRNLYSLNHTQRLILQFYKSDNAMNQTIIIPILRGNPTEQKQRFILAQEDGTTANASVTLNLEGTSMILYNSTEYNLVNVFCDTGNFDTPYNF